MPGRSIRVRGTVQGVGFRPYIWRLAKQHHLSGSVWNDDQGVMIQAWGETGHLQAFVEQIPKQLPPLAKLEAVECAELHEEAVSGDFVIAASRGLKTAQTQISPDAATCPDCLREMNDPQDRRYRYPFINCTHCGPRISIVETIPYDRCNTSMAAFVMCPACRREYEDPADRRFHAQANCCPACGPQIKLQNRQGRVLQEGEPALRQATEALRQGRIVAIKGLGGFHLACDAGNEQAVAELRRRKRRYAKPLALMARDLAMIERFAEASEDEKNLLRSNAAPIVILPARGERLAAAVAIDDGKLGFMLPYTPLHHLLLEGLQYPLVMTSGNISDEPQCTDNDEALAKLGGIADYFLQHDRAIVNRQDDSVLRIMAGAARTIRRARGYCPSMLKLPPGFEQVCGVLAMGAELKNTFCLIKDGQAIVSQHIGDLEDAATQHDYRRNISLYRQLFAFEAKAIAVDIHPGYLSTQFGRQWATDSALPLHEVQHHHAHIAACLAEHGMGLQHGPVLGAVFDGLGMGEGGQLWGGEFLLADYRSYRRLAHFEPVALPGGVQAIREPWRNAFAQLRHYFDWADLNKQYADLEPMRFLQDKPLDILGAMIDRGINSPPCASCGRWFDAFAALLGICAEGVSFEGQAAIALENLAAPVFESQQAYADAYRLQRQQHAYRLNWQTLWLAVLNDLRDGVDRAVIAARIHHTLAEATVETVLTLSVETRVDTVVLSGGAMQNRLLLESVFKRLSLRGKTVLVPRNYPLNDGGVALGQAVISAALPQRQTR